MTNHEKFGYGRVSTLDQNLDAQKDALLRAGASKIFVEKITGTKASRPELDLMRSMLRQGDTVLITRIDRLGRSAKDLLNIVSDFEAKGVNLRVIEQNIDTSSNEGKLFFTMVAAFAEFEHSMMVSRTKDGLAAARARGRVGGRKAKLSDAQIGRLVEVYDSKNITIQDMANMFGISRPTVYRLIKASLESQVSKKNRKQIHDI
jgi:DNA invertase Pin-like site-specific DNA recombinase